MPGKPVLRPARPFDLDALLAIENAAFSANRLSRRQMKRHLSSPKARLWVFAEEGGGGPVAYLLGFFHASRPPRLYSVAVAAGWRGRGLGEALIRRFLDEARRAGAGRAVLEVRADSPGAVHLYEKLGFVKIRRLPAYYEDGGDGFKMMVKTD